MTQQEVVKIINWLSFYYTNKLLFCLTNCSTITKAPYICIIVPYFIYSISVILVIPVIPVITVILANQFTPVIPGQPTHPSNLSHP